MRHKIIQPTEYALQECANLLLADHCVVLPTETVYGLAANAISDVAIHKIYAIKNRPVNNPLIIHVKDLTAAQQIGQFNQTALDLAQKFWPGSLTFIVLKQPNCSISSLATGQQETVAIRCPAHPIFQDILSRLPFPLAAPSANPSQYLSPTSAHDVVTGFDGINDSLTVIDGGPCQAGLESTIIDTTSSIPRILRTGPLSLSTLQTVYPSLVHEQFTEQSTIHMSGPSMKPPTVHQSDRNQSSQTLMAPGLMHRHYAPRTPIRLNASAVSTNEVFLGFGPTMVKTDKFSLNLSPTKDLDEAARNLFNYLHLLDNQHATTIAVAPIPNVDIGIAINDRLRRAATSN